MIETVKEFDGKRFLLRVQENDTPLPLVICIFHAQASDQVEQACDRPLNILLPLDLDWDEDLSPWPAGKIVMEDDHFTGQGPDFAKTMARAVAWAQGYAKCSCTILAGYSMGGLFALYAPTVAGQYDALVCASGSVWFPDFLSYMKQTAFRTQPKAVYLSLGSQESKVRNRTLRSTEAVMEALEALFVSRGIDCTRKVEPGNHFQDPVGRLARGILWSLEQL